VDGSAAARAALDAAHAADPKRIDGVPAELRYADAVERWIRRLVPAPSPALALAARCQHLERWAIPRADYPLDKPGYHRWRRAVQVRQGERARALLLGAGCAAELAERVGALVAKDAARDPEGQALEDAACLVFLEDELAAFAAQHHDYPREKVIGILRKTWAKMSPPARTLALGLPLDEGLRALVVAAVSA
jgi:hypothetical protein